MNRRSLLCQIGAGTLACALPRAVFGRGLDARDFGVLPDARIDQSTAFQRMVDDAARQFAAVHIPVGLYVVGNIRLPDGTHLIGSEGTVIVHNGSAALLSSSGASRIALENLALDSGNAKLGAGNQGLLDFRNVADVRISGCSIRGSSADVLYLEQCAGRISRNTISDAGRFGLYAVESRGLSVSENQIKQCGNGGIIIHRWSQGRDGTVIENNRISKISATEGGTGQWGNAINTYLADDVRVVDNLIQDAAFSAVRANTCANIRIERNTCLNSGETAIYAEFGYRDAHIADNIIDGAANGISATNMDSGGRGAIITGNTIRNIVDRGPYPADPPGFGTGISVEADATVSGNRLENIARYGINAGWGPYLDNCTIAANSITNARYGIGVSVVEGAGSVRLENNAINAREGAIRMHRWTELAGEDLLTNPDAAPSTIMLSGNHPI